MKRLNLMLVIGALLLAALACSLPGQNTTETPEPDVPTDAPTEAITEEVTEAPTEAPTEEVYTCAPGMLPGYAFTVEFCYPSAYATGFNQALIAEVVPDPNLAPWDFNPDMIELNFNGYPVPNDYHTPTIWIYPVADYIALEPNTQTTITNLQTLLANQDPNPTSIPFLPKFNAAQMMQAQVSYLTFRNGQGVRFVTQYGQAVMPINNVSAFYAFSGLTEDGQYFISATFPITHPNFAVDNMIEPAEGWEVFSNNYETYITNLETTLAGQPTNAFTPDLAALDAMMESFLVPVGAIP